MMKLLNYVAFITRLTSISISSTEPTCTIPNVEYGSFSCKTALGLSTVTPDDGDVCELTCDARLFLVDAVNPVVTCRVFGTDAQFDKTPSCSEFGGNKENN